ncbi:hypothetical protein ACRRTK_014224 [Alexandromys fortis]
MAGTRDLSSQISTLLKYTATTPVPAPTGVGRDSQQTASKDKGGRTLAFLIKQGPSDPRAALGSLLLQLLFW